MNNNNTVRFAKMLCATALTLAAVLPAAAAELVYMTGASNPWDVPAAEPGSNETALNTAFGAGNWTKYQGFSMNALAADTRFMFLDGSDQGATQFSLFLAANQAALAAFVANGGGLILNAAPNVGESFSLGFGATLNYPGFSSEVHATQAGINSGIFNGLPNNYSGNSFTHASVTGGAGYVSLLDDDQNFSAFGVKQVGAGMVGFGGMTLPYWHQPSPGSSQLLANMLNYVADGAQASSDVPEPGSMMLIGLGLAGAAFARRRKT